jgi:E3 ubiquitin-protein ligase ATL6/9/15/31/42/55
MAPAAPPTTTMWPRHGRTFLRPLLIVLAFAVRPASSQLFTPPPGDTFSRALSPPSSAADVGGSGFGTLTLTTSLLFVALIVALFLLGFFSAYLRCCADAATGARREDGIALGANAAVAAATAAAFASVASGAGGRRQPAGLDAATMEALPVLTYATARAVKAGRGALECAVCLAEFGDGGENLRLLPGCCHVFHAACIDVWLAAHVTCPVCRADLSDPAVADAGHVLAADLAAQAETTTTPSHHTAVNVDTSESTPGHQDITSPETAEERVDRYTLRLPERIKREIEAARRHRRAMSAVTAAAGASSGRWTSEAFRTLSAACLSRRWSGFFRALSGSRRSEPDSHRRVMPLHTDISHGDGEVEVVVVQGDAGTHMEKYYAHSLTFAGFVIDGDVAAGDWNPEVFQVSTAVPATKAGSSQR